MENKEYKYEYIDNSKLTPIMEKFVLRHILNILPNSISPNTITLISHAFAWIYLILIIISYFYREDFGARALYFFLAGLFVFLYTLSDALDGIFARKTGKCSKLGEILDHWLDAMHVPILGLGFYIAINAEWWGFAAIAIANIMVYFPQLLLYYRTGKYIHPESGGMEGAFTLILGLYCYIPIFLFVPYDYLVVHSVTIPYINMEFTLISFATFALSIVVALGHLPPILYFVKKLDKSDYLSFVPLMLTMIASGVLYGVGLLDKWAFIFLTIAISLRFNGGLVIAATLRKKSFPVVDFPLIGFLLLISLIPVGNLFMEVPRLTGIVITGVTIFYLVMRSLYELQQAYGYVKGKKDLTQKILF
jgi:phosphatidylglycerophosphate synthase